ncbi:hypothetical protein H0H93_000068 [Arthromyces matolae]|nr:hypothetical protein H0H93_000068 [Arthromyces matolae]
MDEAFVDVCFHQEKDKEGFYGEWFNQASAKHSNPLLAAYVLYQRATSSTLTELRSADALRRIHPGHSVVLSTDNNLNILNHPGVIAIPEEKTPLVTNAIFAALPRSSGGASGVLLDLVQFGIFKVAWDFRQAFSAILHALSDCAQFPQGFGTTVARYLVHQGPEEPSRRLLLAVGAWSIQVHEEIWIYNDGFWQKDHGLWVDVQKGNWNDVILNSDFKRALQKDVYGFFSSKKVYKDLGIPWKRGLIMHGPPGKAFSRPLHLISSNKYRQSFKSWKGEEASMADVFGHARKLSPCLLILEDLDSLINDQNRSFFLNQLDGLSGNDGLLVIATTNHFERLDPGLSNRPSRFDRKFKFDNPDLEGRRLYAKYWQNKLKDNKDVSFTDKLVYDIATSTERFSFAYLKEAFVSSLVELAGFEGNDSEKPTFEKLINDHIKVLRKQLDDSFSSTTADFTRNEPVSSNMVLEALRRPNPDRIHSMLDALSRINIDRSNAIAPLLVDSSANVHATEMSGSRGEYIPGSSQQELEWLRDIRQPTDPLVTLFKTIGISQAKAQEAAKSPKSAAILKDIIENYPTTTTGALSEKQAGLLVSLSGNLAKVTIGTPERDYLVTTILEDRLKSVDQVTAAVKFVDTHKLTFQQAEFDQECGVGFVITPEELTDRVSHYIASKSVAGWASLGAVISALRATPELRWANPVEVKDAVERKFRETFGEKEAAKSKGKEPKDSKPTTKKDKAANLPPPDSTATRKVVFEEGFLGSLHKPGENPQANPRHRETHLAVTGGNVWTRFPPEPNGFLHIGHSKAIFVNFGYAAHHNGKCYLRYDDTNPEKEEAIYFESILEMVRWLGFEPWKITYSSDYFDQLYDLAVELIKRDKAYVCHCTQEEIKVDRGEKRGQPRPCVHRNRPISESLIEFEAMKNGKYRPKEANLRMKQDLEDGNPQMWDLTAYRVLDAPHHRTHDKWKIYPTYDFTHCLVDSFENISHSLCTTEFIASRQSYEWLCDAVDVYKPRQSEYGRLNLEGTIMSKRKIHALVNGGYVNGWDDPRLYTLIALRRRGVPPGAIISFVSTLGVSTAASNIEISRFEQTVRQYLENTAPRLLMVVKPLKVTIENLPEDHVSMIEKPLHPKVPELGTSSIPFTRTIYIESDDFRLEDSKDYFRLAPGKTVGLFGAPYPITYVSHKLDSATGDVIEVVVKLENDGTAKKPKTFIQWVAEHVPSGSPVRIDETRIFHRLFKSDRPSGDVSDLAPDSLEIIKGAMVETGFWALAKRALIEARLEANRRTEKAAQENQTTQTDDNETPHATSEQLVGNECVRFQGLRVGYFALDKDARLACLDEPNTVQASRKQGDYVVLNRIVSLKEDTGKTV